MTGFHPGVRGILCAALAQNEQTLAMMRLAAAADPASVVDAETEARYTGIIAGLKRLMVATETNTYGQTSIDSMERMLVAQAVMGRVARELADYSFGSWSVSPGSLDVMLNKAGNRGERVAIREIADLLGFEYSSRLHGTTGVSDYVVASGEIDGVEVNLWVLTPTELPHCVEHRKLLDTDGQCAECGAGFRHALMPDGAEEPRCGQGGHSSPVALFGDDVTCPKCRQFLDAEAAAEESEVNDSAYDFDLRDTHALEPDGGDVALCGAIGGRTSPIDADVSCYGCLAVLAARETDTTPTEPPGDAP